MTHSAKSVKTTQAGAKSIALVLIMLISLASPMTGFSTVSAHGVADSDIWPKQGSNDTGWQRLDATGADPNTGAQASADWVLNFAPGAELSNVSLQIRVNGSDGLLIEEPILNAADIGINLFDWRGYGMLGSEDDFTGSNPHTGRLNPNSDVTASWTLPSGAEITELIIEALAPADPATSLAPLDLPIRADAVHPDDGRLMLALNDRVVMLDDNNNPKIVDILELDNGTAVMDIAIDEVNRRIYFATYSGGVHIYDLDNSEVLGFIPDPTDEAIDILSLEMYDGVLYGSGMTGLYSLNSNTNTWTNLVSHSDSEWSQVWITDTVVADDILYTSTYDAGVFRYDIAQNTAMSPWSTANFLHSDFIYCMLVSGNQILFGSYGDGVARYDWNSNFWLSTWTSANWLQDDYIWGMQRFDDRLVILNGENLDFYNTTSGVFQSSEQLTNYNLKADWWNLNLVSWPAGGTRGPSLDTMLATDASGQLIRINPTQADRVNGTLTLASGPVSDDMGEIIELNNILYLISEDRVERYDVSQTRWLEAKEFMSWPTALATDGTSIFVGFDGDGVIEFDESFIELNSWDKSDGLYTDFVTDLAVSNDSIATIHSSSGFSLIDRTSNSIDAYDSASGMDSDFLIGVAINQNIAYIASEDSGVLRYDITNSTFLASWISTGVNTVNFAPVEVVGDILHLGLPGYGVARKDLSTGDILTPLTARNGGSGSTGGTNVLPSTFIYALESSGSNLYIGTGQGAIMWDGSSATNFVNGQTWDTRPNQFFDFVVDGSNLYAGTNIGLCKYTASNVRINDCLNAQDGIPNWAVQSVGVDTDNLYAGTNQGVGVIDKATFTFDTAWGTGFNTNNAPVAVIGDIAYIGLDGMGVLRYNITTSEWLTAWTVSGILDTNGITSLVTDIRANHLWVGGDDGLQLIDVVNETRVADINKGSTLFPRSGDPLDMIIHGDILYYHQGSTSEEIGRININQFTAVSSLDIATQLNELDGDMHGLTIVGDILMASIASWQWWNADGSGGIAQYNISNGSFAANIEPTGQVDRVTAYQSSNGNRWVSWGEIRLDLYASNGTLIISWDDTVFSFPIREIIEYDGETLFATEGGVARYDESSNQWLTTWTEGNGLPNNAGDHFYEFWTDGTDLVVGGGQISTWGQFRTGVISHLNSQGSWTTWEGGDQNIPNGYPISMVECGGYLNIAMWNNWNGGIVRLDLTNNPPTTLSAFTTQLADDNPSAVACDSQDTLYIGYYVDDREVSKYSYTSSKWLNPITSAGHNLPSDRIWWDAMDYDNGFLIIGHGIGVTGNNIIGGGYSTFISNGASSSNSAVVTQGSSVTSFQSLGTEWLLGQAGGTSGYSHVDTLSQLGQQTVLELPGLVSGQVPSITGNSTHIWATTMGQSSGFGATGGSGILQGTRNADGTVEWDYGWTLAARSTANDLELVGDKLYISTQPSGLFILDVPTGVITQHQGGMHSNLDGMVMYGNEIVIGLEGRSGSSPGVQLYDTTTSQFTNGKLIAGLPNGNINGFTSSNNFLYIATDGGIGRWNYTSNDWDNALTTMDGLATNIVEDILYVGGVVVMASNLGVMEYSEVFGYSGVATNQHGLQGTSSYAFDYKLSPQGDINLYISHDGKGSERPGVTEVIKTQTSTTFNKHIFDQIPSNTVTAITSDWWGVHIATDVGSLTHYNAQNATIENGAQSWQIYGWPVKQMMSDGNQIVAVTELGLIIIEATTFAHSIDKTIQVENTVSAVLTSNHLWATTATDGLIGYERNSQWTEVESFNMRRANPLNVGFNLDTTNITDMAHIGQEIQLVDLDNTVTLDPSMGSPGVHSLLFQGVPLAFSSSVQGAATWAESVSLKYNVTLDLSNDPNMAQTLQSAVDNGVQINGTSYVTLTLRSPSNGSLEARLVYDWVKTETPVSIIDLVDRPDDGGGALFANWSLVHDEDFARYLVYVNEGPWTTPPTVSELQSRTIDKAISLHSRLGSEIETSNGQALVDGTDYYAVIVVEYNDGRFGVISDIVGPASPSDEVPTPPLWANAQPHDGGEDGDLDVEWARCTALDHASTRIYSSTSELTDALGLSPQADLPPSEGNSTILSLQAGRPYWLAFTCVDEAGQEDLANATIIGPVVPTGGLNDNTPPADLDGVWAIDTPNDDGGRVTVGWNLSQDDDCAFYTIWMKMADGTDGPLPTSVEDFSQAEVVNDCQINSTIIDSIDGIGLQDGMQYWVGVTASDDWLNVNLVDIEVVEVTPWRNTNGAGSIPDRIGVINAFDHPQDDGTAIDVVWSISDADDFSHYIVWVADNPVSDLSSLWTDVGDDPSLCGCLKMNKQWIDEDKNPIEVTLSTALYGETLEDSTIQSIKPDVELYVTVTVHDIKGNVYLDNLVQATVIPIDNLMDDEAPERLGSLSLSDRPMDDGTALLLDFDLSQASDVASYEVYASSWSFTSVGTSQASDGPQYPIATLERNPELPLVINLLAGDTPVIPGQEVWVAVVVRDSSGNAFEDNLLVVSNHSIDDGITDMGAHLPDIEGVTVQWNDEMNILVSWHHSNEPNVRGYQVYISDEDFSDTSDATLAGEVRASQTFLITSSDFGGLANDTTWYIAVSAIDDFVNKETVDTVKLEALGGDPGTGPGTDGNETDNAGFESLLTTPNLLAAVLVIVALLLVVAIVRTRSNTAQRDKNWELQQATWGIQAVEDTWGAPVPPAPPQAPAAPAAPAVTQQQASDIYSAANRIQQDSYGRQAYQQQQPVMMPANDALFDSLVDQPAKSQGQNIDTSFLDDLL